ncbi:MAG: response regulator [Elusimicrobiales bacterium]|nr:response regulator [Elusimicrobiales bacterium]
MGEKILVVDDDLEIQLALKGPLEAAGYVVDLCDNGKAVAEAVKNFKPDLLLLDVMLPGVDGLTLAMRLAEDDATCRLPILVVSGLDTSEALFSTLPQVKGFITKPFDTQALVEKVRLALLPAV